jgi:hypothetical protein
VIMIIRTKIAATVDESPPVQVSLRVPPLVRSLAWSPCRSINITVAGGKTTLSRPKINVRVGQKVILDVTSDTDDESPYWWSVSAAIMTVRRV